MILLKIDISILINLAHDLIHAHFLLRGKTKNIFKIKKSCSCFGKRTRARTRLRIIIV